MANISIKKSARQYLPVILCAFMLIPAHAQKKGYSRGYIITNEGESVEGWVKDRSSGTFIDLYAQIRFKPDNARGTRKYSPAEIQGYGLKNQQFESMPLREESSFFNFRYYLDEGNYLDYIPLFYRDGFNEMVRVTQGILGLKRNKLMAYFADCPELAEAIEKKQLNETYEVYDFYTENCSRDDR